MVAGLPIVPMMQISKLGFRPCVRRAGCLLAENRKLRDIVASRLILDWSPEQISGWLKN
jgi:IS30 family transposase